MKLQIVDDSLCKRLTMINLYAHNMSFPVQFDNDTFNILEAGHSIPVTFRFGWHLNRLKSPKKKKSKSSRLRTIKSNRTWCSQSSFAEDGIPFEWGSGVLVTKSGFLSWFFCYYSWDAFSSGRRYLWIYPTWILRKEEKMALMTARYGISGLLQTDLNLSETFGIAAVSLLLGNFFV